MKVEIELSELEALRRDAQDSKKKQQELQMLLDDVNEKLLVGRAISLSHRLFNNYMAAVFKQLGFGAWEGVAVRIPSQLEYRFQKNGWWNDAAVEIEVGAHITNKFRGAFLSIGVSTDKLDHSEDVAKDYKL